MESLEILTKDRGSFSLVHLGELSKADGSVQHVALKQGKCERDEDVLQNEGNILAQLHHKNVVKLISFPSEPLMLVLEYMEWRNLEDAVQLHEFSYGEIVKALHDVACGMEYISEKKFVHKDVICRNILVDSSKLCKISDFGLSRYFGDTANGQFKEMKYMLDIINNPPESRKHIYSAKTDVWAFGIMIWELYSLREKSLDYYHNYGEHMRKFRRGAELPHPPSYPKDLFDYVKENLLNLDPHKRPDFTTIKKKIEEKL